MPIDLATLARAQGIRRKAITLRPIVPTSAHATDLAQIILPAVTVWSRAKANILAGYVLPIRDGMTTDSARDMQSAIDRSAEETQRLVLTITPLLRRWAVRVERIYRGRWTAAVKAATGIDLSTILTSGPVDETIETFLARMTALVKDISAQAQGRIADAVFRGYQEQTPLREVAKQIDEAVGLGRKRALRIASHQNANFSAALDRERRAEVGVTLYQYRHSGKLHPRANHKARDGYVYSAATGQSTNGGPTIPADDRAGMAPFCGCREMAWIPLLEELD